MRKHSVKHLAVLSALSLAAGCAGGRSRAEFTTRKVEHETSKHFAMSPERLERPSQRRPTVPTDEARSQRVQPVAFDESLPEAPGALGQEALPLEPAAPDDPRVESSGPEISLATLEAWALQSNPAIRQAAASANKAMGFRSQVGLNPNPTIGYMGQQLGDAGTDQHLAFLSQDIVLGDKLRLNGEVVGHGVQSQLWEVEAQRFRVVTDVRLRFYEALAAQQRLDTAAEFRGVLVKGVEVAEARKAAAEGTQPEILLARIQLNEIELVQQRAQFSFEAAWKELASIVGVRQLQPTVLVTPAQSVTAPRDWDGVYQDLVVRSPELKAANSRVCRAAANVRRQEAQPIPNLQLEVAVGHDQGTGQQFGQVQAGMPIPVFNKNQGNIDAAQAEYCRATQDVQRLRMSLSARLARAAQEFDSARVAVEKYEQHILPQADENLKLSEQAYEAGEFSFLQVLISRRVYFDAFLQLIDARRELAQANATIDGLLLTGGLNETVDTLDDDSLRGQSLDGQ